MDDSKIPVGDLTGASETLLIPLVARAQARIRFPELGFSDPAAERILKRLDVDPHRFDQHGPTMRGAVVRAQAFDRIARSFAANQPGGLVVNLGAGLDTRADRVADGGVTWTDLELPAVANIRRRLLAESQHRLIATSITDPNWAGQIGWEPGRPLLLMAEAVLIYLRPDDARGFLSRLPGQFPSGAEIVFDYGAALMVRNTNRHPGLKNTTARFQWSARGARDAASYHPRLRMLADRNLSGRAVVPLKIAAISRALRLTTGGWLYGLAHLAIEPEAQS